MNDEIVHGIPSPTRLLRENDVLSLDFGAIWEGMHSDSAVTVFVGGQAPSEDAARLVKTTEAALEAAIEAIQPGGRLSDIGFAIESVAAPAGFGIVREYGGHGIGREMHEDPFIQNWGPPGRGPDLRPGLVVAVEPMLTMGEEPTRLMPDGWTVVTADGSLAAHFEHTVAVTEQRPRDPHPGLTTMPTRSAAIALVLGRYAFVCRSDPDRHSARRTRQSRSAVAKRGRRSKWTGTAIEPLPQDRCSPTELEKRPSGVLAHIQAASPRDELHPHPAGRPGPRRTVALRSHSRPHHV